MNQPLSASRWILAVVAVALIATSCSSSPVAKPEPTQATIGQPPTAAPTTSSPTTAAPTSQQPTSQQVVAEPPSCEVLDSKHCLLPFPSNFFTVEDASSDTGLRVALPREAIKNADGVPIDFTEWNRNDGFSPNSTLLTYVPGLDADKSDLPSWTDLEASLAEDASVVLIDTDTGERTPLWAELDAKATTADEQLLVIHPAVVLTEGHRYVAGLRNMTDATGASIEPTGAFLAYRDGDKDPSKVYPRPAMEQIFADLTDAGVARESLYVAWDFTVASQRNISERMLSIRDEALAALGDAAPAFTVTATTVDPEELIALRIDGTYTVANFLTGDGGPGNGFHYGTTQADGRYPPVPERHGRSRVRLQRVSEHDYRHGARSPRAIRSRPAGQ